jgi:hypothetical protein
MEEHPQHWRHTLMGYDFWQDAKQYEDKIRQELDIGKVDPGLAWFTVLVWTIACVSLL